jgi:ADP-ribose pyrophosphatase
MENQFRYNHFGGIPAMTYKMNKKDSPYIGPVFSVERIELTLPDNRSRTYDRVTMQNAVTILPIDDEGNVYFVRQFRVGSDSELLELPAGKIEAGESAQVTAEREIREETGMAAREMLPIGEFYMSPGYSTEFMYCFLARGLYRAPLSPDADEFLNVEKIPLDKVKKMAAANELPDSKSLAVLMLAWEYLSPSQPK